MAESNQFLLPKKYLKNKNKKGVKKNMKKIIMAGLIAMALVGISGMASASTHFDANWNGSGSFDSHFYSGDDAEAHVWTSGDSISGEFHGVDKDNNPHGYGVDNTNTELRASVTNGIIGHQVDRTDSKTSMYGDAGQSSYTVIDTAGTGSLAWRTASNFASMRCCNYGFQANNQIRATGSHWIYHEMVANQDEGASIEVLADANTDITSMSEEISGKGFRFGGCGCYTNENVHITGGSGLFALNAYADNQINTDIGISVSGPDAHYGVSASFGSEFHFNNFALRGN
jgi:hypothetical protein